MKIALVTTPPSVRSGIGDYTRHLLPYLREHAEVEAFVQHGADESGWGEQRARPLGELDPSRFDRVLYQLGNEQSHAFMARMIRVIGGTVMQHDWVLFDMALKAFPALGRGGAKGHALALREGGLRQVRIYARNWLDRRRQRLNPAMPVDVSDLDGVILAGWHQPESAGRWTADNAAFRLPSRSVTGVRIEGHVLEGRQVRLRLGERLLGQLVGGALEVELEEADHPTLTLETHGVQVTPEQRLHGDTRRLACFVTRIVWTDRDGEHSLDLDEPATAPHVSISLSRDRFALPFNRSVVRHADSFIVHSRYVKDLILAERNQTTPIGIVHHGSEFRWRTQDRKQTREELGLPPEWVDGFLVTSFGGVQRHKRIDKALKGLALARETDPRIHMVLAGSMTSGDWDPRALAQKLGVADAVRFTGYVPEEVGWDWLHAGDVALNLRGPSSGGTSGGIFQAFSMGRPVLASDACEQRELPDSAAIKVPLGDDEVACLSQTLVELAASPTRRAELEAGVRAFVENECHWGIVARRYVEHLQGFPRPRISRKQLVVMRSTLARVAS